MSNTFLESKIVTKAADVALGLLASFILAFNIPWRAVFNGGIPGGGDNPAHPVLMQSLGDAFFHHGGVIHYSYKFWNGFEAFQFYFPLPYLFGSFLSLFINSNIAFKLITVFGPLALSIGVYGMFRQLRVSKTISFVASLLMIPFQYTEAHVMWGANVFSDLAGMIGNAWAFVFFPLALGALLRSREEGRFNVSSVIFSFLATFSHFYALLMLTVVFFIFFVQDLCAWLQKHKFPFEKHVTYLAGAIFIGLSSWWLLPLIYYRSEWSAEYGGDWNIELLKTFARPEKIAFASAFTVLLLSLFSRKQSRQLTSFFLIFAGLYTAMFFLNDTFNTSAFLNVRIWPTIYFCGYLSIPLSIEFLRRQFSFPSYALLLPPLWLLMPPMSAIAKANYWMTWNFQESTKTRGWTELNQVVEILKQQPAARISYESGDNMNSTVGTVRAPELLPYLTQHELVLGGIVNSAPFSGIGYMLQCLTSNDCAGWPNGSVMPEKDHARGIKLMRRLGVQFHLAFRKQNMEYYHSSADFVPLFEGEFVGLYKLREPATSVEVFDRDLPVLCSRRAQIAMLNLPRWDKINETALIFNRHCTNEDFKSPNTINPAKFLNFLIGEWRTPRRAIDRGWGTARLNRLNTFLFSWRQPFDPVASLGNHFEFFIADRGFDPDLQVVNNQRGPSELGIPLLRDQPGKGAVMFTGRGYRLFVGEREITLGKREEIEFSVTKVQGAEAPFTWVVAKPIRSEKWPYLEFLQDSDPFVHSGLPGTSEFSAPVDITSECHPRIERSFQKMILYTDCPGKPHLIKQSYYPKWRSNVAVHLASYGFMALTPTLTQTVLTHSDGPVDVAGKVVTGLSFILLVVAVVRRRRDLPRN